MFQNKKFDVVMIDFPWNINCRTREGNQFIKYDTLRDKDLFNLNISEVQDKGFLFMWVVNKKLKQGMKFMEENGYR